MLITSRQNSITAYGKGDESISSEIESALNYFKGDSSDVYICENVFNSNNSAIFPAQSTRVFHTENHVHWTKRRLWS
jgi:hypothetical protein